MGFYLLGKVSAKGDVLFCLFCLSGEGLAMGRIDVRGELRIKSQVLCLWQFWDRC